MDVAGVDSEAILVLNSGSSSLKFGVYRRAADEERPVFAGSAEGIGGADGSLRMRSGEGETVLSEEHTAESQAEALEKISSALHQRMEAGPRAVGHRIVHGGPSLREHQRITPEVLKTLQGAVHFAPLHIPESLKLLAAAQKIFPEAEHYACLDTTFHRSMPDVASHLPLPPKYFEQGVQRYGFHGLSCESIVYRLGDQTPERMVIAHLGNGSSVTAVRGGRSIDTSMGLTPTGGVPMGTRSGDLDPGVLLYLMRTEKMDVDALEGMLNHTCGLAGYSGGESDMQALERRAADGDTAAELAIDAFSTAVRKYVGGYAALLGGLDLLVFTGGIGEHSEDIRRRVCAGLEFAGVRIGGASVRVMHAEEELTIARHCRQMMSAG